METSVALRHKIIENLMAPHTEKVADTAIILWAQLATQIISIIGEGGFNSLYARSVFLAQPTFPWLAVNTPPFPPIDHRFAILERSFEGRTPEQVSAANNLLLITFTDILDTLIGEQLTTRILNSAWGAHTSEKANKEFNNE